jgi:hypothetical protein
MRRLLHTTTSLPRVAPFIHCTEIENSYGRNTKQDEDFPLRFFPEAEQSQQGDGSNIVK